MATPAKICPRFRLYLCLRRVHYRTRPLKVRMIHQRHTYAHFRSRSRWRVFCNRQWRKWHDLRSGARTKRRRQRWLSLLIWSIASGARARRCGNRSGIVMHLLLTVVACYGKIHKYRLQESLRYRESLIFSAMYQLFEMLLSLLRFFVGS